MQKAIYTLNGALRVFTEIQFPIRWAMVKSNIGNAYANLTINDRGENLKKALDAYENALKVWTLAKYPSSYQMVTANIRIVRGRLQALIEK